jgi:hypothetical protein
MRALVLLSLPLLVAAGCNFAATAPGPNLSADTVGEARIVADLGAWPADALEFLDVRIRGDTLVAEVRYGGGCREHRFALVFGDVFMESDPVQVRGMLSHDADGDLCRALLGRTLRYDLGPLRRAYLSAYGGGGGTVVLNGNWPGSLRYEF